MRAALVAIVKLDDFHCCVAHASGAGAVGLTRCAAASAHRGSDDRGGRHRAGEYTHMIGTHVRVVKDPLSEARALLAEVKNAQNRDPSNLTTRLPSDPPGSSEFSPRRRIGAVIAVNRRALAQACPLLSDALDVKLINAAVTVPLAVPQLREIASVFNAIDDLSHGRVSRDDVMAWVADKGPTDVGEGSVMIDALLRAVVPSAVARGYRSDRVTFDAEEFVVWAHAVCVHTPRELAGVAFAVLATLRADDGQPAASMVHLSELLKRRKGSGSRQPADDAVLERALASPEVVAAHASTFVEHERGCASGFKDVAAAIAAASADRSLFPWRAHESLAAHSAQYVSSLVAFQLRGNAYERFPYSLPTKTTEEGNAETVFTAGQVGAPVIAGGDVASRYSEEASVELRTPHEADVEHIDVHVRL